MTRNPTALSTRNDDYNDNDHAQKSRTRSTIVTTPDHATTSHPWLTFRLVCLSCAIVLHTPHRLDKHNDDTHKHRAASPLKLKPSTQALHKRPASVLTPSTQVSLGNTSAPPAALNDNNGRRFKRATG
jgi:hypothetical protein